MINDLLTITQFSLSVKTVLVNLVVALGCGLLISFFYRKSYHGAGQPVTFINSIVILAMITAVVIMVIGNNLARAFGLVGAMSIIRFRTAVKETQDIVYIFFALAIGMAAGVGLHSIAITGTLFIGIIAFIMSKTKLSESRREYLLQFNYQDPAGSDEIPYLGVFHDYCRRYKIINTKTLADSDTLELSYYIDLKDISKNNEFVRELRQLDGVRNVNLYFDEEYY